MKYRVAVLVVLCMALLTVAAAGAAAAPAPPGAVTGLTSATHPDPDLWYPNNVPNFNWDPMTGISGYSWLLDQVPGGTPGAGIELSALSFSRAAVTVGTAPWKVNVGDVNGDGDADLAVANNSSDTVSVLLGDGDGTFQAKQDFAAGNGPSWVVMDDFNGDGDLDLAVTDFLEARVSVLLGNGDGTFDARVPYVTGGSPHSLATGDFNEDGYRDLVVAAKATSTVNVLLGNGDGTFQAKVDRTVGPHAEAVVVGDFDGDGYDDVACANYGVDNVTPTTVSVLLGNGDGTFEPAADYPVGIQAHGAAAGDLNGDGRPDLAVVNWVSNTVSVLLNDNGNPGAFLAKVDYAVTGVPADVVITDINNDGIMDIVTDGQYVGRISVLLGIGDGTFLAARNFAVGTTPRYFAVADFNKDGLPDLALPHDTSTTAEIVTNTMNTLRPSATYTNYPKADGIYYFHVRAESVTGQLGAIATRVVRVDKTPPATTDDAPATWVNHAVTVTLSPTDASSGMTGGQAGTWYRLDGGAQTPGTSVSVTTNGTHTITYFSKDAAGNAETPHSATVRIGTGVVGPTTVALAPVTVTRGGVAVMPFRVNAALRYKATVTIKVFQGTVTNVKKTLLVGLRWTNINTTYKWTCTLPVGTYKWVVYAVDPWGNKQVRAGYTTLVVK